MTLQELATTKFVNAKTDGLIPEKIAKKTFEFKGNNYELCLKKAKKIIRHVSKKTDYTFKSIEFNPYEKFAENILLCRVAFANRFFAPEYFIKNV